jgi:hypothetical protein
MTPIDWNLIALRENPFAMSPPDDPTDVVWADMSTIKSDYLRILREAKGSAPTQVVLVRGPVGGGKTHASLFFSLKERWPSQSPSVDSVHIVRVPTPKETGKPDRNFYLDVMEFLTLEKIREVVSNAVEEVGRPKAQTILQRTMLSADLSGALLRLGDEEDRQLLDAYFMGKLSTSELRRLKLNRNIEKTQDYFRVLAGIFHAFIGLSESRAVGKHNRVCLWLDELEDFVYFTPAQYRPFGQGLRELVDRVPFFFTVFLNFTFTSPEDFEEIELILGKYLIDRVTQNIIFDEMSETERFNYVRDMLQSYGTPQRANLSAVRNNIYYPFTEDSLKLALSNLSKNTPRDVNKRCRNTILKAFEEGLFKKRTKTTIEPDFVEKMTMEDLDKEIG